MKGHVSAGEIGGSLDRILRRTLSPFLKNNLLFICLIIVLLYDVFPLNSMKSAAPFLKNCLMYLKLKKISYSKVSCMVAWSVRHEAR
jgi:hypothetical protein